MQHALSAILTRLSSLILALATASSFAQITAVPPATYQPSPQLKAADAARLLPDGAPARMIVLAPPDAAEMAAWKAANASRASASPGKPSVQRTKALSIGLGRTVQRADKNVRGDSLTWMPAGDGGQAARIDVVSQGAAAVRVALAMGQTHPDVTLRFSGSAPDAKVFGPIPANAIAEATARDGTYWSPVLDGEVATIEIHAPPGVLASAISVEVVRVSHLAIAGAALRRIDPKIAKSTGDSGSCEIDIACLANPSQALLDTTKSVAKMVFTLANGQSYVCTGSLLNDSLTSFTPYFYTANHCIDSQYAATNLNTYWFYEASSCKSLATPPYMLITGGAMLLGRSDDWDWALLRLKSTPPAGSFFSAWRAEAVPMSATGTTIHHPAGDLKKFSQGTTPGYQSYLDGSSYLSMLWDQGSTEPGSSGAGLFTFLASGGYYELRGGLYGGEASCTMTTGKDYFSRLDNALPLLRQYLTPNSPDPTGLVPAVEFYNSSLDHYFISTNAGEINDLDTNVHPGWERTGLRFLAYSNPALAHAGTTAVCRFYRAPAYGDSHFYSANPAECSATAAAHPVDWIYESPNVFYMQLPDTISGVCPANSRAVYRFFNTTRTNHRYTAEVAVRDDLTGKPGWIAEGYGPGPHYPVMCSANG